MTSTNLRKAEDAAATVSAIISFFIGLELIAILVLVYTAPSGFGLSIIILGIISLAGIFLAYYSWASIFGILMHIAGLLAEDSSPLEEESVTRDDVRPSDNSPSTPTGPVAPSKKGGKRCKFTNFTLGTRCQNWFDGEGQYCDEHS